MRITLNIPPPKGTAQQQKIVARGRFITKYDPPNVKEMKRIWTRELTPHKPCKPLEGPLRMRAVFAYPYRKADIKKAAGRDMWKDTSADLDNINKGLADVMEKLGFFKKSDGQIASLPIDKIWSANPRVEIEIEELGTYVE